MFYNYEETAQVGNQLNTLAAVTHVKPALRAKAETLADNVYFLKVC